MAQKKKLQVFISSTYSDLLEERQAAVEAILTAGHIPAGMELFAAGDESQMNVIKRWIDESDVYMLILGGRYGSIEPATQKSYIQLEYEYALEKNKPLFAVVVDEDHLEEKVRKHGSKVFEKDNQDKLKSFRALVLTKLVKFWRDTKDIKLAVLETLSEFGNRSELAGWVPGNESVNTGVVAEEIARLAKENAELREKVNNSLSSATKYNGLTFEEMYKLLDSYAIDFQNLGQTRGFGIAKKIQELSVFLEDTQPTILHYFWMYSRQFREKRIGSTFRNSPEITLFELGIIDTDLNASFFITESGLQFLIKLKLDQKYSKAESFII